MAQASPKQVDLILPGRYAVRMVKGGPWVAAEIRFEPPVDPDTGDFLDRSLRLVPYANGQRHDGDDMLDLLERIHIFGRPITDEEFDSLSGVAAWASENAPDLPEANPTRRIRLERMRPLF